MSAVKLLRRTQAAALALESGAHAGTRRLLRHCSGVAVRDGLENQATASRRGMRAAAHGIRAGEFP